MGEGPDGDPLDAGQRLFAAAARFLEAHGFQPRAVDRGVRAQPAAVGGDRLLNAALELQHMAEVQRRALDHFQPRLAEMAARIGHQVPPLGLSSARTRWGSCSTKSGIRLNWRLIHLAPAPIDYVIAHEVAHLVEMNHGPRFWRLVGSLHPDWRAARAALKRDGAALPLI